MSGRFVSRACLSRYKLTGTSWLLAEYAPLSLGLAASAPLTDDPPSLCRGQWAGPWSPHRCFLLCCRGGNNLYVAIDVSLCNTFLHFFAFFLHLFFATVKNPSICAALRYVVLWLHIETLSDKRLIWQLKTNHQRLTKLTSS